MLVALKAVHQLNLYLLLGRFWKQRKVKHMYRYNILA